MVENDIYTIIFMPVVLVLSFWIYRKNREHAWVRITMYILLAAIAALFLFWLGRMLFFEWMVKG